ncbi:MAG: TadE family protein [Acidobacteriota bacterium]
MKRERGQSLIEGTLVMLVFFALLLGVVDFGQILFSHQSLVERVRAAARWGSFHPESGPDPVRNYVLHGGPAASGSSTFLGIPAENVHVEFRAADEDDPALLHVEVVNFEAPLFAPWWPGLAHRLMNPRPVSVTAPVANRVAAE